MFFFVTDWDEGNSSARLYERSRIKALADEREMVQKKTFTKWVGCAGFIVLLVSVTSVDCLD